MKKQNDDSIKVCIRTRPLFFDEKQAKITIDYGINSIEVWKMKEEETKTDVPTFMQQTSASKSYFGNISESK